MSDRPHRPRQWWDEEDSYPMEQPRFEVIDSERDDWSGLYDADGRKLMRERQPFGFRAK